ncbi:MAG: peptidase T [Lachnospiraceae bacterium]|nr:peptidase T [Lachnospiraceae bacterium]
MSAVIDRFLRYIALDTQSDPESSTFPSAYDKEMAFADMLVEELHCMGITDAVKDEFGYVFGTIPSTVSHGDVPVLGLIAHMDTAQEAPGACTSPRFIENYDGSDILLNEALGVIMRPDEFESLRDMVGKTLLVTDGISLMGGDDKAGIAEIMTLADVLLNHPEIPHGTIRIGFTPDEEIGSGVDHFDVERFGADYAYTLDGQALGELEYENFNAAGARIEITGLPVHPGSSKNKMKSAVLMGMELESMLPVCEKPMYTEGYEGFTHLLGIRGTVSSATMDYIIRDHDRELFEKKKAYLASACEFLNAKYGQGTFRCEIKDSYYNMKDQVAPFMFLIDNVKEVYEQLGIPTRIQAIRGGTDGARLSFMGLPCPNLGTGGYNCHGPYEYVCVESMENAVDMLVALVQKFALPRSH